MNNSWTGTSAVVNLGLGNGVFEETGSSALNFGPAGMLGFNFVNGSGGSISLLNVTSSATFDGLVTAERITIDGAAATPSQFQFATVGSQGVYSLAVPKPTSIGLLGMGVVLLSRRRRAQAAVVQED